MLALERRESQWMYIKIILPWLSLVFHLPQFAVLHTILTIGLPQCENSNLAHGNFVWRARSNQKIHVFCFEED